MADLRRETGLVFVLACMLMLSGCVAPMPHGAGDISGGPNASLSEQDRLRLGKALISVARSGDIEKARTLIARGAEVNTMVAVYWTPLGMAAAQGHVNMVDLLLDHGGDADFALQGLIRLLSDGNPNSQKAIDLLTARKKLVANRAGWACYAKEEYEKAIPIFQQAIQQDPSDAGSFGGLSACHEAMGHYDEAVTAARQAIVLKPNAAFGHSYLGKALWKKRQYTEAEKELKTALDLEPKNIESYYLGRFYLERGRYADALPLLNKVAELLPKGADVYPMLLRWQAKCNYRLGQYDAMISCADRYLDLTAVSGVGIRFSKQPNDAPRVDSVLTNSPAEAAGIQAGDGIIAVDRRRTSDMSPEAFAQSVRGPPGSEVRLTIWRRSAKAFKQSWDVSVKRQAIELERVAVGYAMKSVAYREKGDAAQAAANAAKALDMNPADENCRLAAGVVALDNGHLDEAVRLLLANPTNNVFLATAYAKKGDFDAAAAIYQDHCDQATLLKSVPDTKARQGLLAAMRPATQKHVENAKQLAAGHQPEAAILELAKALVTAEDRESDALRAQMFALAQTTQPRETEEVYRHAKRGEILLVEGDLDGALHEYEQALRLAPYSPRLYFNTALVHGAMKNYPQAIHYMKIYQRIAPRAPNSQAAMDAIIEWELRQVR